MEGYFLKVSKLVFEGEVLGYRLYGIPNCVNAFDIEESVLKSLLKSSDTIKIDNGRDMELHIENDMYVTNNENNVIGIDSLGELMGFITKYDKEEARRMVMRKEILSKYPKGRSRCNFDKIKKTIKVSNELKTLALDLAETAELVPCRVETSLDGENAIVIVCAPTIRCAVKFACNYTYITRRHDISVEGTEYVVWDLDGICSFVKSVIGMSGEYLYSDIDIPRTVVRIGDFVLGFEGVRGIFLKMVYKWK